MENENNELRLFAAEVIRKPWIARDMAQLAILKIQINAAIENLEE